MNVLANTTTPTSAPINSLATLIVNGSSLINVTNATLAAGTYVLVDYGTGSLTAAQFAQLALGTTPTGTGFTYSLVNDTANTSVDLVVSTAGSSGTLRHAHLDRHGNQQLVGHHHGQATGPAPPPPTRTAAM